MIHWLMDNTWWVMAASLAMVLCGMAAMFALAILMPADHFLERPGALRRRHPVLRILLRVLKNVVGAVLLVVGILMAIPMVPGPGLLVMLLGISLMDVPGKRTAVRYVISRPLVLRPVNILRARWNRPPLQLPDHPQPSRPRE